MFLRTLLCLLVFVCPTLGQSGDPHEECEKRIRALEQRLALVETQLSALLAEEGTQPPEAPSVAESSLPASPQAAEPVPARHPKFEMPPELVPEIGKIGAEVGVIASAAGSPFQLSNGSLYGGFIDLPLLDEPRWMHGKLSYEIMVGLSRSRTRLTTTSNVAQVANLAALNALNPSGGLGNINAALTGTGEAPFPVETTNQVNLRLLQVVPFELKYTSTILDRFRLRPYGVLGFGIYVSIHNEQPTGTGVRADAQLPPAVLAALIQTFSSQSPFGSALVAGQIGQSPELVARGLPGGNGNIEIGWQTGGGFEFRLSRSLSLGFDARFNRISGLNGSFGTYGSRIAIHF